MNQGAHGVDRQPIVPELLVALREGYPAGAWKHDLLAGLTVAIVALPLSMAIAIASGVPPERGLFTAIAGGFLVSALGGSRYQIGGPAGAFIVLVSATVAAHGLDGLILATLLSGFMLMALGWLRLGRYITFIPYPVTVGFTAGIGAIIFVSQIGDLFGLPAGDAGHGGLVERLGDIWRNIPQASPAAMALSAGTVVLILGLKRFRPGWPGMIIAITLAAIAAAALSMPVETIGSRFGGIPRSLPVPALPDFSLAKLVAALPSALSFTLLGAIESLLSAVVADGMSGRRHRSDTELVGQGVANIGSALFGGFCVTGTIARTATNVRAGAVSPLSGMAHALFLLGFMALAAPLAAYIPLAALAGVLVIVAWNMVEKHAIAALVRSSRGDAAVLVVTLLLVIFRDLSEAILVGFALGALLFIDRMGRMTGVGQSQAHEEAPDMGADPQVVTYRISGAFFFGAASTVGSVLDRIADKHKVFILDFSDVPLLDSTAANVIEGALRKAERAGVRMIVCETRPQVVHMLKIHGVKPPRAQFAGDLNEARTLALDFVNSQA